MASAIPHDIQNSAAPFPAPALRLVFWELTSGCNLKCRHCRATAQPERSLQELSTAQARQVIDDLAAFASPILVLTGGEPLYRPDIFQIAEHARDVGLRVALATNGTLLDDTLADRVAAAGIRRASISIDGADAATHDAFRGLPGSFARALTGVELLTRRGVEVQFNCTIARHNVRQLSGLLQLAQERGATALHLFILVPVGCGVNIADEAMLPPDEVEAVLRWMWEQSLTSPLEMRATCAPQYQRIARQGQVELKRTGEAPAPAAERHHGGHGGHPTGHSGSGMGHGSGKGCLAGSGVCFISHRGDVQPCGYLPLIAGNVLRQPLSRIWAESQVFLEMRNPDLLTGRCGVCEFKRVCGGCRARALGAVGDYLAEEPSCNYVPRSFHS